MLDEEYKPNPKLGTLAEELEILNAELIRLGLSDKARLLRLKMFAESTMGTWRDHYPKSGGVRLIEGADFAEWEAILDLGSGNRKRRIGLFDSPRKAHEAFRRAHLEHFGIASPFHPDYVPPQEHHDLTADKPIKEPIKAHGKRLCSQSGEVVRRPYTARIVIDGITKHLGSFPTHEEARAAYEQAHIEHYGTRSEYHPDYYDPSVGVRRKRERFYASITIDGKYRQLGTFETQEEAHAAFQRAHVAHWGEKSRYFKRLKELEAANA